MFLIGGNLHYKSDLWNFTPPPPTSENKVETLEQGIKSYESFLDDSVKYEGNVNEAANKLPHLLTLVVGDVMGVTTFTQPLVLKSQNLTVRS